MICGFESVRREFHCIDGGEPGIAHDQKECSQIFVIATRLEDCRHLHFRERYNGRLIVVDRRPQASRRILRDPFHVYGKFEEALQAFGLLEACRLRHPPTLTKFRHEVRLGHKGGQRFDGVIDRKFHERRRELFRIPAVGPVGRADEEFSEALQRGVGHSAAGLFSQKSFNGLQYGDARRPRFIKVQASRFDDPVDEPDGSLLVRRM